MSAIASRSLSPPSLDPKLAQILTNLISQLACEVDLHYEDDEIFVAQQTIFGAMAGAKVLTDNGYPLPESYEHIVGRYFRHIH